MNNNHNSTVKSKGSSKLKYFLIFIIIIAIMGALYYRYYNTVLVSKLNNWALSLINTQDANYDQALTSAIEQQGLHNNDSVIADIDVLKQSIDQNTKITNRVEVILEEMADSFRSSLQKDNINYIISSYNLIAILETSKPFSGQVELLTSYVKNDDFRNALNEIKAFSQDGIPTNDDITKTFHDVVYKDAYLSYYRDKINLKSRILYYMAHLVFIKNLNNDNLRESNIIYKLNAITSNLQKGNLELAHQYFVELNLKKTDKALVWEENLVKRIKANELIELIKARINSYTDRG